jgi:hypothetical protein
MNEIKKIVEWVEANGGTIKYGEPQGRREQITLIIGSIRDKQFRIFLDKPPWAGFKSPNGWGQARACYTLEQFVSEVEN